MSSSKFKNIIKLLIVSCGLSFSYFDIGIAAEREILDCDIYAASDYDDGKLAQGIEFNKLNPQKAIAACIEGLKQYPDDARLQYQLGRAYNAAKEIDQAFIFYKKSAEKSFPLAFNNIGALYLNGEGVDKDPEKAFYYFKLAADKGVIISQRNVADLFKNGNGVAKDLLKAFNYYKLAADGGDPYAQYQLGLAYANGNGVKINYNEAFNYYKKAADQNNVNGEFWVAYSYANGQGVPKNIKMAIEYYKRSSTKGNISASSNLGIIYLTDVEFKNYALALYYNRISLSNPTSQANMGYMYSNGYGVPQNYPKAHMWYNISASTGNEYAIRNKAFIEQKMIPHQIAQAQELARHCQESKFQNCGEPTSGTNTNSANNNSAKTTPSESNTGSGFFINQDGYIATNQHVVNGCKIIYIKNEKNEKINANLVISSKDDDLAIIKVDFKPKSYAEFRSSQKLNQGETVISYGYPLTGLLSSTGNVTTGLVTALTGLGDNIRQYQISAEVQPGNSGGPLVDDSGLVIGVVVAKLNAVYISKITNDIPQNINFAIRSSYILNLLDAKNIKYFLKDNSSKKDLTEITNKLREFTTLIECIK